MTMPDYITAYLDEQGVCTEARADPLATFATLRLDALDRVEMFLLIEEHAEDTTALKDDIYEAWQTLADVVETARGLEGVGG